MPAIVPTCVLDASNLNRGLAILRQGYSKRTPAEAVNSAAYMVAKFTYSKMKPGVDPLRMDAELQVTTVPIMKTMTRGPRKGKRVATGENEIIMDQDRNAAMMIVLARMRPGSRYNKLTGGYWALQAPSFKAASFGRAYGDPGMAARLFWQWVEDTAVRMVKARHSSSAFLLSCWIPAIRDLEPFVAASITRANARYRTSGPVPRGSGTAQVVPGSGWGKPAPSGALTAVAEIANAAGVGGKNSVLNNNHNAALWDIVPPLIQQSINEEYDNIIELVGKGRMEQQRAPLLPCGMTVIP